MKTIFRTMGFWMWLASFCFGAGAEDFTNANYASYYVVHEAGSTNAGELKISANYTLWLPPGVKMLRGVIVHQHGCGPGDDREARAMAGDLQWQALARKQGCGLLVPTYEQSDKDHCRWWHDPRNGSDERFVEALGALAAQSGHPELTRVPWALWGHSGGACWVGSMFLLHPERVAAVWLRSNVPLQLAEPFPAAAFAVPVMCNLGTREGVTETTNNFIFAWPVTQEFFAKFRGGGGLAGVAVDPNSGHDCGNSRYLAIPWLDACLTARLPDQAGDAQLKPMPTNGAWLASLPGGRAQPAADFKGEVKASVWLPNERIAKLWSEYVKDGNVSDATPPPAPKNVRVSAAGELSWEAEADLESGIAEFVIERDGKPLARWPEKHTGYFVGRPTFQQVGYGDEVTPPLLPLRFTDTSRKWWGKHTYAVRAVNTVGLESEPGAAVADASGEQHGEAFPAEILAKQWPKGPETSHAPVAIKLDAQALEACAGRYEFAPSALFPTGATLGILREDEGLAVRARSGTNAPMTFHIYPESATTFFLKTDGSPFIFVKNEQGEVTAVIHRSTHGGMPDTLGTRVGE